MKKLVTSILGLCVFASATFAQVQTFEKRITASSDDVEERGANATSSVGAIDLTSSDLELTRDGSSTGNQFIGMRFTGVNIPQGAIIQNAYIQFEVDENPNEAGTVTFEIEASDNASTFTSTAFNVSSRPRVAAVSVNWSNIPLWTVIDAQGPDQRTPDLKTLVQAVVNRSGWASGNAMAFIASGTGKRVAEAYDGEATAAPKLVVQYVVPVTATFNILSSSDDAEQNANTGGMDLSSSDLEFTADGSTIQVIGLRYGNVSIPQGSQILSAYVQFTADEVNTTGTVNVLIAAENSANSAAITGTTNNIAGRSFNFGTVPTIWNPGPFTVDGESGPAQRTPNIAGLIQTIVNNVSWASGNALLLGMVDPAVVSVPSFSPNTAKRVAQTFDRNPANAAKLIVSYIPPATYQNGIFPIAAGASWKYLDNGTDLSATNWTATNYNDSTWAYGNAPLGYGDPVTTTVGFGADANNKFITTYLRNTFTIANPAQFDSLEFRVRRDDGVVVYVNGVEVFRQNMPAGAVTASTLASSAVGGADETSFFLSTADNILVNGLNVIAVELHQSAANSSDLVFDMSVSGKRPPLAPATYPFVAGSAWHYRDGGTCFDGMPWNTTAMNDDNWPQGAAPLGYGDPMATTISFGPDANNKAITYYFRRDIDINLAMLPDTLEFGLRRDDGAVVYINGVELFRSNMPSGAFTCDSTAPLTIAGGDETTFYTYLMPKSVFNQGINLIAVEVHNRDVFSSDLGFDFYIKTPPFFNPPALGCSNGNDAHFACFTSLQPSAQGSTMIIPSTHRFQMLFKQGQAYSKGGGNALGNHDFTGYVATNGSSELGHLSINHETAPGGVSMLDMHYDNASNLWVVDTSEAIDFSVPNLVRTERNCSGGVTPWGTVVTAEETGSAADANGDGYFDVGWLVEIDPVTAKVVDYNNDGIADKIWAAGKGSHENACFSNDSAVMYWGEDGGSSAVFKYVLTNKADLSSGMLYVLKLDQPLVSGEPTGTTATWVMVPNTTQSERNNTTTLAIGLGATNFNGVEDVEIGTLDGKIYFTGKGNNRTWRFTDNGMTVSNFETFVGGTSYNITSSGGNFTEAWGSGNDNLTFDDNGNLYVLQDGSRNHLWMVRPDHTQSTPKVELFIKTPAGSEPCGMTFSPDYRFAFISIQHPSGSNAAQMDASGNMVTFNASAAFVIARSEHLGAQAPSVSTVAINNVTPTTASVDAEVTDQGGPAVTARGVVYSTNPNPTTADMSVVNGAGMGAYTTALTGLTLNETYYVRAYATNAVGTSYGNELSFTTGCVNPLNVSISQVRAPQCPSFTAQLRVVFSGGTGAKTVLWSTGETTKNVVVGMGTHYVTVTDASGCSATDTFEVMIPGMAYATTMMAVTKASASSYNVSWNAAALPMGANLVGYVPAFRPRGTQMWMMQPMTAALSTVIDFTGMGMCNGNYEFTVFVRYNDGGADMNSAPACSLFKGYNAGACKNDESGLDAADLMSSIEVYPNPTRDVLRLVAAGGLEYVLTDVRGQVLMSGATLEGETRLDLSSYAKGIYMIRIGSGETAEVVKVVKE